VPSTSRRSAACAVALAILAFGVAAPVRSASAQGLLEALFGGGFQRRAAPRELPENTNAFADPFGALFGDRRAPAPSGEVSSGGGGGGTAYCVRTCDGRFFPLQRHASASPAELCKSFCPASKTAVFTGSKIDTATSANGGRYADLDTAFVYRTKLVDNCTCNGKDSFGLARLDVASDPTLRPGDIVATTEGFTSFKGRKANVGEFTPIDRSNITATLRKQLAETKVTPAPASTPVVPVAEDTARRDRQASR
jgi:hypothetical protein